MTFVLKSLEGEVLAEMRPGGGELTLRTDDVSLTIRKVWDSLHGDV